jgi:hypothetical protein
MRLNPTHPRNSKRSDSRRARTGQSLVWGFATALAVLTLSTPAQAYIDPGTGGMILQLLLGGVAGALVVIKLYWLRIKEGFQSIFGGGDKPEEPGDNESEKRN